MVEKSDIGYPHGKSQHIYLISNSHASSPPHSLNNQGSNSCPARTQCTFHQSYISCSQQNCIWSTPQVLLSFFQHTIRPHIEARKWCLMSEPMELRIQRHMCRLEFCKQRGFEFECCTRDIFHWSRQVFNKGWLCICHLQFQRIRLCIQYSRIHRRGRCCSEELSLSRNHNERCRHPLLRWS